MNKHEASAANLLWFISFSLATNQAGATVSVSHQRSHKTVSLTLLTSQLAHLSATGKDIYTSLVHISQQN